MASKRVPGFLVHPSTGHEVPEGEYVYSSTLSLTSVRVVGWVISATSGPLYPRERLNAPCIGGWLGPRVGLDEPGKSRLHPPGFDSRTIQPVACRYTD